MKPTKFALFASVLFATGVAAANDDFAESTQTWWKRVTTTEINPPAPSETALGIKIDDVKFAFDSARVEHDLTRTAEQLRQNPQLTVVLDGYADPTGSDVYNVKLSLRRTESVRSRLVRLGVNPNRIVMGVFGEDAKLTGSYADARRVSIRTTTATPKEIVDLRLDPATAVVFGHSIDETAFNENLPNPEGLESI